MICSLCYEINKQIHQSAYILSIFYANVTICILYQLKLGCQYVGKIFSLPLLKIINKIRGIAKNINLTHYAIYFMRERLNMENPPKVNHFDIYLIRTKILVNSNISVVHGCRLVLTFIYKNKYPQFQIILQAKNEKLKGLPFFMLK